MSRYTAAERAAIESRRVEKVYAVLARVYDDFFDWALGPGRRRAIARLPIKPGDRVLEVGVGTGLSFPHYPRRSHFTGIDISSAMLAQARERAEALDRPDIDLQLMDARELKFPAGTFDHVVAPYVISVVAEPERVMREIARVCKPEGTVLVVNQFRSRSPLMALGDRLLTPISRWIGFRLDLPIDCVLNTDGLRTVHVERVNLMGLWHLLEMRREPD